MTLFLNCALRLTKLVSLNVEQVGNEILTIISKGNKERKIFLTPAAQKSLNRWLSIRKGLHLETNALFISRCRKRITTRGVQNLVEKYVSAAKLDLSQISSHKRHKAATLMYKYGKVDIRSLQQILGHETIATTEIYTHIDEQQLQSTVNSNPLALMFN